ncbi:MAG: hypothetical protein ABXS92_01025 [Sulfurimonas sp.]
MAQIFRIRGDDFVLSSKEYLRIDADQFDHIEWLMDNQISISIKEIDPSEDFLCHLGEIQRRKP